MEVKEFLRVAQQRRPYMWPHDGLRVMPKILEESKEKRRRKVLKMMGNLNFHCNFDADGCCAYERRVAKNWGGSPSPMCCCKGCADTVGYLDHLPSDPDELAQMAELFDEGYGFWSPEGGCKLPRELRSFTCTKHYCWDQYTPGVRYKSWSQELWDLEKEKTKGVPVLQGR